ncbi:MAG TPA: hypothetical protein VND99_05245 [Candidatus Acidoferrales bacterium]|nr:hypothetical protein [Candidatus Acidoferrales bacterium]
MKKSRFFIIIFTILLIGAASIAFILYNRVQAQQKIHYHAGFVVFKNNTKLSFSDKKYMYTKPCTLNGKEDTTNENDQLEKAHLHDNVGDVVHIERSGAVWQDLFTNIKFPLDYSKTEGFINGQKVTNYQTQPIKPDDSLVVFMGNNDITKDLKQAPTKDYMERMAKKSGTCSD